MSSISPPGPLSKIIVGVDTHKHVHVAVVLDDDGQRLGDLRVPVDSLGYQELDRWAQSFGRVLAYGIEGTGSYGANLTSYLRRQGRKVVEVNRGDRRARRANGKSDTLDAELAARSVIAGTSTAVPKSADGTVEMIRKIKVARDCEHATGTERATRFPRRQGTHPEMLGLSTGNRRRSNICGQAHTASPGKAVGVLER